MDLLEVLLTFESNHKFVGEVHELELESGHECPPRGP